MSYRSEVYRRAKDELTWAEEWLSWALETAPSLLDPEAVAPARSEEGRKLVERIQEATVAVDGLPVPTFEPLPTLGLLPTQFDAARAYLRTRVDGVNAAALDFETRSEDYLASLEDLREMFRVVEELRGVADDELLKFVGVSGFPPVAEQVFSAWYDVATNAKFAVARGADRVEARTDEAKAAFRARKAAIETTAQSLLAALAVEAAALQGEVQRVEQLKTAWADARSALAAAELAKQRAEVTVTAREADIESNEDTLNDRERERTGLGEEISALEDQIAERKAWLNNWEAKYDRCPEGKAYAQCTHTDYKSEFVADYVRPRNEANRSDRDAIEFKEDEIARLDGSINRLQSDLQRYRDQLLQETATRAQRRAAEAARRGEAETRRQAYEEAAWTTRVELHAQSNNQDAASVRAMLEGRP